MSSNYYSPIASGYPFYGGLTTANYGAGLHVDWDPIIMRGESLKADYINNLEVRLERVEHILNNIEYTLMYPSGVINPALTMTSNVEAGTYYQDNIVYTLVTGINSLIASLSGVISTGQVVGYPFTAVG